MPPPPPQVPPGYPSGYGGVPAYAAPPQFRSLRGLAISLQIMFGVAAALLLLVAIMVLRFAAVAGDHSISGFGGSDRVFVRGEVSDALEAANAIGSLSLMLGIAIAVVFIIWFWRCAKNLEAFLRDKPRFGPGFAIGGWFIPLANFVLPVLQAQDLWRGSDPTRPRGDPWWRKGKGSALIGWWWAAFVLGVGRSSAPTYEVGDLVEVDALVAVSVILAVSSCFAVVAALLAIFVVRALTARQEQAAAALLGQGPLAPVAASPAGWGAPPPPSAPSPVPGWGQPAAAPPPAAPTPSPPGSPWGPPPSAPTPPPAAPPPPGSPWGPPPAAPAPPAAPPPSGPPPAAGPPGWGAPPPPAAEPSSDPTTEEGRP